MKNIFKERIIFSNTFWIVLVIKIIFSIFFASHYMIKGFIPFVTYFVNTGENPYDYFYSLHLSVFPYPALMLLIFSLPIKLGLLVSHIFASEIFVRIFLMRTPILLADVSIYVILCNLLPSKEKRVLLLYFASPIVFYINYFHGQLDSIPTALLFISLFLLFKNKYLFSYLILGLGIATKTHLLLILPFYYMYLYKTRHFILKTLLLSIISACIFIVPNILFFSPEFFKTVFNNPEQQRLFFLQIPFEYNGISLYIAPLAILAIWFRFVSYKKVNIDSLILVLGLTFTVLIALVPPMQGWFYWSLPFLVYFFIKYEKANSISFWLMNMFYLLFFFLRKDSDLFESGALLFPQLSHLSASTILTLFTKSSAMVQNIMFTGLEGAVIMNALWCYRIGMHYNNLYIEKNKPLISGIGGNSGVGKSTLTQALTNVVGIQNSVVLNGDDAHKWERGDRQWRLFTHLNPKSNKIHADYEDVFALRNGKIIERSLYSHATGKFSQSIKVSPHEIIFFQGLHPFFLKDLRSMFDIKVYLEVSPKVYKKWKLMRDMKERGYKKNQITKEIQRRQTDFKKFIMPQKKYADWVITYSMNTKEMLQATHRIKNMASFDKLYDALKYVRKLSIHHEYDDLEQQTIIASGTISSEKVQEIAYQLFPNMQAFLHTKPKFDKNITGINQLIFLSLLNEYYSHRKQVDEELY